VIALMFLVASVSAVSVHFVRGPSAVDAGTTLVVSGKIAGLGNGDVTILVSGSGIADVECTNPGGNVAPGQDTAVTTVGSATFPSPKNGNLVFSVATIPPSIPSSVCPNPQWSAEAVDVAFSSGSISVVQGGVVVLSANL
jgi:type 1 fimbria pilin